MNSGMVEGDTSLFLKDFGQEIAQGWKLLYLSFRVAKVKVLTECLAGSMKAIWLEEDLLELFMD